MGKGVSPEPRVSLRPGKRRPRVSERTTVVSSECILRQQVTGGAKLEEATVLQHSCPIPSIPSAQSLCGEDIGNSIHLNDDACRNKLQSVQGRDVLDRIRLESMDDSMVSISICNVQPVASKHRTEYMPWGRSFAHFT